MLLSFYFFKVQLMESKLLSEIYEYFVLSGKDTRFKPEVYGFVLASLDFHRSKSEKEGHLDAHELVEAVSELARMKFGPMAKCVLANWGVTESIHIGAIVYNLIEMDILTKTDDDTLEQFKTKITLPEYLAVDKTYVIDKKKMKKLKDS